MDRRILWIDGFYNMDRRILWIDGFYNMDRRILWIDGFDNTHFYNLEWQRATILTKNRLGYP